MATEQKKDAIGDNTGLSRGNSMEELLAKVSRDYPDLTFVEGSHFSWHAQKKNVSYKKKGKSSSWALLHELGHALLGHADYAHDFELLRLEVAAWHKAQELAKNYGIEIDEDYIQDCLDTYRDWLHLRSTCPSCLVRSVQHSPSTYRCFNCGAQWRVSRSRLCRPYRLKKAQTV